MSLKLGVSLPLLALHRKPSPELAGATGQRPCSQHVRPRSSAAAGGGLVLTERKAAAPEAGGWKQASGGGGSELLGKKAEARLWELKDGQS